MGSKAELYLRRARTEINIAVALSHLSGNKILNDLGVPEEETFYSGVISHCYYAIFYSAKAMLLSKNIDTKAPEIHRKTLEEFKKVFIDNGVLDAKLFLIYKKMIIKAESLLEIFKHEKSKRGNFTYNTIAQANIEPANESLKNAKTFFKHCNAYLDQ